MGVAFPERGGPRDFRAEGAGGFLGGSGSGSRRGGKTLALGSFGGAARGSVVMDVG
jgi:hypothetical protein